MILYAEQGLSNDEIATRLDTPGGLSGNGGNDFLKGAWQGWKMKFAAGVRPAFPPSVVVAFRALACELPTHRGLPLSRFA